MPNPKKKKEADFDLGNKGQLFDFFYNTKKLEDIEGAIKTHLNKIIEKSQLHEKYEILFIYDPSGPIRDYTADQIYKSLPKDGEKKDILLILYSNGGSGEAAYLISKCCKEYSKKFNVAIPRRAKSAATLIALGADEIHMGQMSHLGPIDPQISSLPALGLGNAVEYLAKLCSKYPDSYEMFAKYLSYKLDLRILGYFERVSESAVQYAQRLLENKTLPKGKTALDIAKDLVYSYKDHGFVIDQNEAKKHLGDTIKVGTAEYTLSDEIHKFLEDIQLFSSIIKKKDFSIIGTPENGILFLDKKEEL
jgi:membrane-bound ClpP family serine protease